MALSDTIRKFADKLGVPSFSGTPFATGEVEAPKQLTTELGGSGTNNFGGFLRGEDFNPEMDSLTAIRNLDIMRRSDAQVNAALQVVTLPIRSADKSIDAGSDDEADEEVAKFLEWNLFGGESIVWDDFLRQALLMLAFGHYIFEKVWDLKGDGKYAGRLYLRKLAPRPPKTIWQWFTDESGELISIKQLAVKAGTYQFLDIPASKLVVFVHDKEGDNYAGKSILRSAYPHWKIKSNLYVVDAIRAVRFGAGIPRAKLQKGYAPNIREKENLVATLSGMSSNQFSYIIQPENVDIDILVPQGAQGGATILPTIEHHNQQITRNVMATFLDMGGRDMGGSNALGSSAMDFFANAVQSIAGLIEDVLNKQVIRSLVDANFDINKLHGYPTFRFSGIKQDDLKAVSEIVTALAGAGMTFSDLETQNTFRNRLGLPEVTEEEVAAAAPPVPDGGVGGPADPSSGPSASGPGGTPRTPPTNQNPQGMRPAIGPSGKQIAKASNAIDRTATARAGGPGQKGAVAVSSSAVTRRPVATSTKTTTASSGDADEEGHTLTEASRTTSSRSAAASTTDPETIALSGTLVEGAFWRTPTELESRVLDLNEMPRKLDTARDVLLATLEDIREEQILRIAEVVSRLPVGATLPKAPLVGKLTSDVWKIVESIFNYGHDSVEKELQRQGAEAAAGPVRELVFADSTDMPFPVELSPYPEPEGDVIASAPVVRIDLSKLVATQASLTQRRVLPQGMDTSYPIIVNSDGVYRIFDGHHRLAGAKANGAKFAKCRVVAMNEMALAAPKTRERALPHLEAGIKLRVQTASEKLVSKAVHEALRLKRSGWSEEEIEDALKMNLGELSKGDIKRLATMSINEAFSIGRTTAAEGNAAAIGSATLSALMDSATCPVCRNLDGKKFKIGTDEYEEHLPPLQGCRGRDHCRCVYVYVFAGAAMAEIAFGGRGSGWFRHAGHVSGSQGGRAPSEAPLEQSKKDLIASMHGEGKSTYQIAKTLGMHYSHVKLYTSKLGKKEPAGGDSLTPSLPEPTKVTRLTRSIDDSQFRGMKTLTRRHRERGDLKDDEIKRIVTETCNEMGFDSKRVNFSSSYEFEVAGARLKSAGTYNPRTGQITLREGSLKFERGLRSILSHEIQHDRFEQFHRQAARETNGPARKAWNDFTSRGEAAIASDDGVTTYSQKYWTQHHSARGRETWTSPPDVSRPGYQYSSRHFYSAVNETLSEMASLAHMPHLQIRPASESFQKLKQAVDHHYATKVAERRARKEESNQ